MKKAFTILELIFVILLIGVLAAVALPKLNDNTYMAKKAVVEDFIGVVNKNAFPYMWGLSIKERKKGDISYLNLSEYMQKIPKIVGDVNLSNCNDPNNYKLIKTIAIDDKNISIYCIDGNEEHLPKLKIEE